VKLPIADIQYDEEKAKAIDPEEIKKIAGSIKDVGLIHEVIVHSLNITHENDRDVVGPPYRLDVGLKRLLATKSLGLVEIECKYVPFSPSTDVDADRMEELSIHENLKRSNDWYREAELVRAAHELYQKRHDKRLVRGRGRPKKEDEDLPTWTIRDTAAALGRSLGSVSQDINLVRAVELHPALRAVKDKRTAMKLARVHTQRLTAEEEQGGDDTFTGRVPRNDLLCGDSALVLKSLPDTSFDACITDPPWLRFRGRMELEKDEATDKVFFQVFRVLRYNTFLYAFVGVDDWFYYRDYLPRLGFTVSKTPLIWVKEGAMSPQGVASWEYNRNFELVLLAVKGTPSLVKEVNQSGVLNFPIVHPRKAIHPHEKPVELLRKLIGDCTNKGASILDPFAGSAAVLQAARETERTFLGIERDPTFYRNGRKRLELKDDKE
jgi:DNA modification methylase